MSERWRRRRNATFQKSGRVKARNDGRVGREERRGGEEGLTWQEKAARRERRTEGDAPVQPPVAGR